MLVRIIWNYLGNFQSICSSLMDEKTFLIDYNNERAFTEFSWMDYIYFLIYDNQEEFGAETAGDKVAAAETASAELAGAQTAALTWEL
uniref:Uncharacterized protein n=1 Tax=Romanomermis culicivorax TaxID=13658 RepID=A0A915KPZ6_ROMCU